MECISVSLYLCILVAVGLELLIFFSVVMYSPLMLLAVVMYLLSYVSYSLYYEIDAVVHYVVHDLPWCSE